MEEDEEKPKQSPDETLTEKLSYKRNSISITKTEIENTKVLTKESEKPLDEKLQSDENDTDQSSSSDKLIIKKPISKKSDENVIEKMKVNNKTKETNYKSKEINDYKTKDESKPEKTTVETKTSQIKKISGKDNEEIEPFEIKHITPNNDKILNQAKEKSTQDEKVDNNELNNTKSSLDKSLDEKSYYEMKNLTPNPKVRICAHLNVSLSLSLSFYLIVFFLHLRSFYVLS